MKSAFFAVFLVGCGPRYIDVVDLTPTTLGSGLVAHWAFDETGGTVLGDDSGNRRDGVVSGATFTNDGRFNGALHFRPGDGVTVDQFPYATLNWSFSAWVRIAADDIVSDDFGSIVSTEMMQAGGWQFQTHDRSAGTYWTLTYWIGPGLTYAHYECACFELGRWSHATMVVNGAANLLSFYVDDTLVKSDPLPAPILPGTSTLYMGKWMGAGRLFSGSIDDVAIYNRALSAAEVAELNVRPPPPPK